MQCFFDRGAASRIVADLDLVPSNRLLIHHWLSLWNGDSLPDRNSIRPAELKSLLANLIMFDVVPGKSVTVRLAGTSFGFVLGMELTGKDWIDLAPEDYRAERLHIFTDIASGAIGRGVRTIRMKTGDAQTCEELLLPFQDSNDDGTQMVLCHVDWNPDRDFARIESREQAWGEPLAFETIQLPLMKAA